MADQKVPFVAIVVVNWNNYSDTASCLLSLQALEYPEYQVILVDNGSTDGSGERLQEEFKEISIICNNQNLGFGGGCNAGIEAGLDDGADYVFLLNNDAHVEPSFLDRIIEVAESVDAKVTGALIENETDHLVNGSPCFYPDMLFYSGYRTRLPFYPEATEVNQPKWWRTDRVEGAGVLLPASFLKERKRTSGHFLDDSLFMYGEEIEMAMWCRERGFESIVTSDAVVTHRGASGSERSFQLYYLTRNRPLIAREYLDGWRWLGFSLIYIFWRLGLAAKKVIRGHGKHARAIIEGLADGLRGRRGRNEKY